MTSSGTESILFAGHALTLLPARAVYWPSEQVLAVADVHIGKGASFRARGVPVPSGATAKDLSKLAQLVNDTRARTLVIVGDFLHASEGHASSNKIADWRRSLTEVRVQVIRGNHDVRAGRLDEILGVEELDELIIAGIAFVHDPAHADPQTPTICGHIHPSYRLADFDRSSARVPCFVVDEHLLILPSFGSFTGSHSVDAAQGRSIYVTAAGRVVRVG